MKLSKSEIRREIEKLNSEYETGEIFSSPYLGEILQAVVTSACSPLKRIPKVRAFCDPKSEFTACTEGKTVSINTLGPLIRDRDTNWERYINNVGHVIHECGHVLFTDFIEMGNLLDGWAGEEEFRFYPKQPAVEGADLEKLTDYLNTHPNYRRMLINEMKGIQNCMEDVYIENCLFSEFDGLAAMGLAKSREELYRIAPYDGDFYEKVVNGEITPLLAFSQLLLTRRTGYPEKHSDHLSEDQKKVRELMDSYFDLCEEEIDRLKWEPDGRIRCEMLNRILVKVQPLLPEPPDNEDMEDPAQAFREMLQKLIDQMQQSEGDGEGGEGESESEESPEGGSSPDYSSDVAESQNSLSAKLSKKAGSSEMPDGNSRPVNSEALDEEKVEKAKDEAEEKANSETACKHKFEQAVKDVAQKEFEAKDEEQHSAELQSEANEIEKEALESGRGGGAYFNGYTVRRSSVDQYTVQEYNRVVSEEIGSTSKHLAKKLSNLFKDRETESCDSGYLMGQRFNARDVVHNDGKYFSRITVPDGKLRVCFGILVDESGSMGGQKYLRARRATILLEAALRAAGVPLMIVGHTTNGVDEVVLNSYVDFDTNDGKDCYRLANITADYGNIDGGAITYVGEKLLKRPEEQKVLIVISDGLPAGTSFYSYNDDEDTALAAKYYRKKGCHVFGAVVDEWESVSDIYEKDYCFDCRENGELERQLIRLVKRFLH
ncbi:MAG: hypothetical protein IJI83_03200 [Oscillospiraceae bacterium]|nr:hypothetical protein [Oscillospiraceae bacterium]